MKLRFILLALTGLAGAADTAPKISGIWMMGQSLCDGSESLPVVTSEDTGWGNLTLHRGVRTWLPKDNSATPELRPAELFKLVPLRAQTNGGLGETVANGMADHWQSARFANDKARAVQSASRFLVACAGQGGRQIQELSIADLSTDPRTPESRRHGGGYYRTSLDDARRAMAQAKTMGAHFRIDALYWMQGEGNGGPTGSLVPTRWDTELPRPAGLAWYRDQLIAYRKQWSADLCAITGQGGELPMFTYQTLGPAGEAQLMAADADQNIWLVGPHYAVPSAINSCTKPGRHGDPIHLSADGERWWGEQVGKVMHRVLDHSEDWQPLRPRSTKIAPSRDTILIDFTVPRPPLVLDTTFLARQEIATNGGFTSLAGFRVHDSTGRPLTLTSVEVIAPTQVRLRLLQSLPADKTCRISYGHPYAAPLGTIASLRAGPDKNAELIRAVSEINGVTVLQYDPTELRNGVPFEQGQSLVAQRSFSYGNLRDSDPESSIHTFTDTTYGTRAGQPYPLWNW
ncbi:MAG: phosphate ABC transporter substrate-binding protein [Verrucomicrobia bacterium]|nr:phosphate ABC transporter substrate-binding protein [Verrucomicrobiota bacterium]